MLHWHESGAEQPRSPCRPELHALASPTLAHDPSKRSRSLQIHLFLFLIAVMHVVTSVLMILLAGYRLRQWRSWQVGGWWAGGHGGGRVASPSPLHSDGQG